MKYLPLLLFIGCASPVETINREIDRIIQTDTVTIYLPGDTVYTPIFLNANGEGGNDNVDVKVDTVYKVRQVYVRSKPDTVKVAVRDTVTVVKERIVKDEGFFDLTLKEAMMILLTIVALGFLSSILRR